MSNAPAGRQFGKRDQWQFEMTVSVIGAKAPKEGPNQKHAYRSRQNQKRVCR